MPRSLTKWLPVPSLSRRFTSQGQPRQGGPRRILHVRLTGDHACTEHLHYSPRSLNDYAASHNDRDTRYCTD